jgi:hypothetical protein
MGAKSLFFVTATTQPFSCRATGLKPRVGSAGNDGACNRKVAENSLLFVIPEQFH